MSNPAVPLHHRRAFWGGLFIVGMFIAAGLVGTSAVEDGPAVIIMLMPMLLLIPFMRANERSAAASGAANAAQRRYSRRFVAASFAYVLGLGAAITIDNNTSLEGASGFLVALLPVLPIFWMIYVMGRYLVEEQDEYLRHRAIIASLIGLGLVLAIGSFWGFLETFEMVPHAPGWWAVPIWAMGMGLGQAWQSFGDRRGADQ